MNRYTYKGDDVNLGRFGSVRRGDVLILTDNESDGVAGDKRFERLKDKDKPKPGVFITLTDKMTPIERQAAEKANAAEKERLATLAKENDEDKVEILEIKTKTFDELASMAANINAEAKATLIDVGRRTSRAELIRQIMNFRRNLKGDTGAAPDDETEQEEKEPAGVVAK